MMTNSQMNFLCVCANENSGKFIKLGIMKSTVQWHFSQSNNDGMDERKKAVKVVDGNEKLAGVLVLCYVMYVVVKMK